MTLLETLNLLLPTASNSRAPHIELRAGRYLLRFAQNAMDLDAVWKLRFEVFNLNWAKWPASYRVQDATATPLMHNAII
ncbi:MAG: hypothetical protein U0Y68_19840 [Blastocatellia bacterium]